MIFTVALTGGIGSGKSTVADLFARAGVTVVDADVIARRVVEPGLPALNAIVQHFGANVLNPDGSLNRRRLREIVFDNDAEKSWLNQLLHPLIQQETHRAIDKATSPYVLWVVPLLVENKLQHHADRVLVVDAEPDRQLHRTMQRDKVSQELAQQILAAQVPRDVRLAAADDVINNNGSPRDLIGAVTSLHQRYLMMAAQQQDRNNKQ